MTDIDVRSMHLRMLILVVAREAERAATKLIRGCHVPIYLQTVAEGTASSDMLDMMGLESAEKTLMICMARKGTADAVLEKLRRSLVLSAPGMSVAMAVPLTGITVDAFRMMDEETRERVIRRMEREVEKVSKDVEYSLVMIVANRGYSDEIVSTAKEAGATGGTVVAARRVGLEDTLKVWGISVQEEKELILIAIRRDHKAAVMRAVSAKHGIRMPAHAFAVSLPVDGFAGLDGMEDDIE